jgi:hypothetical protein
MNLNNSEYILRRERLHKGLFILPALVFVLPLIPIVALCFFISIIHRQTNDFFQQMQAQSNPSGLLYLPVLVLAVPWLLVSLVSFVSTLFAYLKSEITLTNQRLLFRTGFILRVSGELPLENIETIFLVEPLLGRILGYGTILLTSVGAARFPLRYIGAPQVFHEALQSAVAAAKTPPARIKPPAQSAPLAPPGLTAATAPKISTTSVKSVPPPSPDDHSRFMPKS